jgi:hypothetical protein
MCRWGAARSDQVHRGLDDQPATGPDVGGVGVAPSTGGFLHCPAWFGLDGNACLVPALWLECPPGLEILEHLTDLGRAHRQTRPCHGIASDSHIPCTGAPPTASPRRESAAVRAALGEGNREPATATMESARPAAAAESASAAAGLVSGSRRPADPALVGRHGMGTAHAADAGGTPASISGRYRGRRARPVRRPARRHRSVHAGWTARRHDLRP